MLQLWSRRLKTYFPIFVVIAFVQTTLLAKCISVQVALKGEIVGSTKNLRVVVEITSATKGDSTTEVEQKSSIEGARFEVLASFNTTSNVVSAETCDRTPHLVTVKLIQGDQVLDHQILTVEKDFRRTKTGDYELKKPITLRAAVSPGS